MNFFRNLARVFKKKEEEPQPEKVKTDSASRVKRRPYLDEEEAKVRAREIILDAKDQAFKIKREAEEAIKRKDRLFEERLSSIIKREEKVLEKEKELEKKIEKIEEIRKQEVNRLERIAGLTKDEAKELIFKRLEKDLAQSMAKKIKDAEDKASEEAERKAREILVNAMQKGATDYVVEHTISQIKLDDEEMKGRVIGKEGRNIRAFEQATGVDVDLDEENIIRLSSFDPVRREIAQVALKKLIADGRIQPARIEEVVKTTRQNIEKIIYEEGRKLAHKVGVYNLPSDKIALLGKFKYRFSYGQNMIAHTLEETKIGIALAEEVGADVNVVRLGCLLHDIGKVVTDEEGSHVKIGTELLKKNGMPQAVIDCVAQHHGDIPFTSIEAMIVNIADSISGARPGARFEDYQKYIERLSELEEIAKEFKGVKEAYAFQAGRELRVAVSPEEIDDAQCQVLAYKIKKKIEEKVSFPGQVKVTVIRELRAVETTK